MRTIDEFMSHLQSLNVKLWVEGDRLRYRAPQGTMTPALTAELRQSKADILRFLDDSNIAPIEPVPDQPDYELSHAQRRLWILSQLAAGSAAYTIPLSLVLEGDLDREALEKALSALVRRHESLRTTFIVIDSEPRQRVHGRMDFQVDFTDLMEDPVPEEAARHLVRQETLKPFNLETGPLLRVSLMKLARRRHVLFLGMHHIVSDGVSLAVLTREFIELYQAIHTEEPVALPALPIQYRDFASWQNQLIESLAVSVHRNYWHEKLSGEIPVLNLPTDFPRPAVQTFNGKELAFVLDPERTRALVGFSRRQGATLFMTLIAMLKVLLYRYTGQRDIIVGSPIAGRDHADLENQIGLYLNTLALRDQFDEEISFESLLQQVKQTATEAYDHQIYPFDRLVGELGLSRDLSRSPLFDVMVILQNTEIPDLSLDNIQTRAFFQESRISKFDLTFEFEETRDGLQVGIEYNTDLFREDRIQRMAGHFRELVDSILADAGRPIARLNILPTSEQKQVLHEVHHTGQYARDRTLSDLFELQAARSPDAVAVTFQETQLTYSELNVQANQVAHYLQSLGIKPGMRVAIYLERSLEMVTGLIGILKTGAAYVPLDPAYPKDRLAFMLEDSQAAVILTRHHLLDGRLGPSIPRVCLDADRDAILRQKDENPPRRVSPDDLAYVIYTSGSTGKPKGVGIFHHSLVNFLTSMRREPGLSDLDRVLAVTTTAFDIAALELYLPLVVGARVVLASREEASDGSLLRERLVKSGATVMQATPATWRLLLKAGWQANAPFTALCGGEALPRELARQLLERCAAVWNLYGPTETTVWSAIYKVDPEPAAATARDAVVPIGRPVANTDIYVLDRHLQPVPLGVPGELHIGGAGIAQGYLNRPELTAEKFIPSPFSKQPGARLYRTGDLVCCRSDGNLEFLGRMDDQVKIRGFRIELGEVEAVLADHPAIRETVITAREDQAGDKQLAAYVVPSGIEAPSASELHSFLKKQLPDYMVPSTFTVLDKLPRTLNGKVNRRALPAADRSRPDVETTYVAPTNRLEGSLAAIWQDLLNLEKVGVRDNFFELGGHSLKATQVVSRIHKDLGIEVALREIFNQPTIEELAREIASRTPTTYASIPKVPDAPHYPVSHAQRRLWVLSQMGDSSTAYSMPDALLLEGAIDPQALELAFAALIQRHESLRTTFITVNEELRQVVHPSIDARLSFIDLTTVPQPEVQAGELARQDAQASFDLQRGPLIRFSLLKLALDRHVLLSNMHHIISDGWSIAVLEREFITLYHAFLQGRHLALPPLRIQYRDFACWQNRLLDSPDAAPHRDFWLDKLSGEIPALNLPADFPRPAVKTFNGKTFSFSLSPAQSSALAAFSRQNNVTLFMTLAALLNILLQRYSGQHDIILGCPVAGRDHTDLKDQIGFYVNTLPLRSHVLPHLSFEAFLDQVRKTCTDAYEHQIYPFDRLVHELNLNRDISRSPLFDVMLALQNVEGSDLSLDHLRVAPFFDQYTTSQFDLTFSFEERDHALHATLWYNTDLFLPDRIARLSHHFQQLVASVLDDASQPLGRLNLLPDSERHQILNQFNQAADYSGAQTIVQLFEDQVEKTPQAVALVFEDRLLTYRELNARANQLAHHLLALGVQAHDRVGICADRSLDLVVGLLGILKAGAAYVPFDLAYPKDRLAFMLNDSQVQVLLTQQNLASGLPPHHAHVLCLDSDWNLIAHNSQDNPPPQALPEHPAYVIYTSGSTGLPKGTLITHHNVTRLFAATQAWFHFDSRDVWTLFHSYAFDFSVWELWGPLLHGGRLVVVPYWVSRSPEAFHDLLCAQQVTVLNQTPSAFRQLIQADQVSSPSSNLALRLVIFGGEALDLPGLKPWFERHGDQSPQLVNMYGITETTVHVTYRPLSTADLNSTASLIGAPIPDLQVHILDPFLQPAPIGVSGEIYVAGPGLAPGYLHRPDLTAERFIPNPFSSTPGARLYKSGDLARYLPNGDIEYFGRLDHQVKIRGFRIELGEIEALLASHPDVAHAVVIARQDHPGDSLLAAYVVPKPLHTLSAADLRATLKEKLPDYMIPAAFVFLDSLPLTANGKIDRRALPAPDGNLKSLDEGFVAPRTDLERVLAGIYAGALSLKQVSIHANFFELGGHSLLATQVVSRVRESLKVEVSLPLFFRAGTVAELAAVVLQSEGNKKQIEKIASTLEKLKGMSEEEKRNVLAAKRKARSQS